MGLLENEIHHLSDLIGSCHGVVFRETSIERVEKEYRCFIVQTVANFSFLLSVRASFSSALCGAHPSGGVEDRPTRAHLASARVHRR